MRTFHFAIFITCLFLSACTNVQYGLTPQSHFDFPNSNVIPLGRVMGEGTEVSIGFIPPQLSGDLQRQVVENALSKKPGADILLNYTVETKITNLAFIFILTYKIYGTSAKMEIGIQDLH